MVTRPPAGLQGCSPAVSVVMPRLDGGSPAGRTTSTSPSPRAAPRAERCSELTTTTSPGRLLPRIRSRPAPMARPRSSRTGSGRSAREVPTQLRRRARPRHAIGGDQPDPVANGGAVEDASAGAHQCVQQWLAIDHHAAARRVVDHQHQRARGMRTEAGTPHRGTGGRQAPGPRSAGCARSAAASGGT